MAGAASDAPGQYYPGCPAPGTATNWSVYFASLPSQGGIATIPAGVAVYVDVTTPDLDLLVVEGALVFDH